jgi:hypothetical protein
MLGTIASRPPYGIDHRRCEKQQYRCISWGGGVTKFIEERIKLVRSLAEKADPFIKPRLLALADRYEGQLSRTVPTTAFLEIGMPVNYPTRSER